MAFECEIRGWVIGPTLRDAMGQAIEHAATKMAEELVLTSVHVYAEKTVRNDAGLCYVAGWNYRVEASGA